MATQTQLTPSIGQFFNTTNTTTENTTPPPQPSYLSSAVRGVGSLLFSPVRMGTAEAAQGAADRFSELLSTNEPEITNRIRTIFINALLQRTPDTYHKLLHHIQAFLRNPSTVDLDQIKVHLAELNEDQIRSLDPRINHPGVNALLGLAPQLEMLVTENPPQDPSLLPTLTVDPEALTRLGAAEIILKALIENYEGVLNQTLNTLTQSMSADDGPLRALRDQLNHPQHGILTDSLRLLRTQLTSRATPLLRETKNTFDAYRAALTRGAGPTQMQNLQTKIAELLNRRDVVPQINVDQWTQMEQFNLLLQGQLANPTTLPAAPQLLTESEAMHQVITTVFADQRGMVEEAADILVEGIGRGVEQLVTLPNRMIQDVLSGQGAANSGQTQPAQSLDVGTIHAQGSGLLHTLLASAGSAFSSQAANSLATLMRYTFEKIRDHVQLDGAHPELLGRINPMIERLKLAITNNSWAGLMGTLQDAFQFMQEQQVYLQGLRLPLNPVRNHVSAIPDFLNNINAHQNALQHPSQQIPQRVTTAMIEQQSERLKLRSASYGPAKLVIETICGLEGTSEFYAEIYHPSLDSLETDLNSLFRERLFAKIDGSSSSFVTKWVAKIAYDLIHPLSTFYIHTMIGGILEGTMNWMKTTPSSAEPKEELFIKLIRNWMAVTSGAYNQVANTPPSQSKDFQVMMEEALKNPERNGGLTQQELFAAMGKTLLDTFGPKIRWSEAIDNYFTAEIPTDSPIHFLNPIVQGFNVVCSLCLKAIVFIPQWVGNQILQSGAKLALSHTPLLKEQSEKTIESLRRNTPSSYAMHQLIFRKQQKILATLQQSLNTSSPLTVRNSNIKKIELTGLVQYALEILNKGQYLTQDRLQNYLNNRAPLRDRAAHELEDTFLPEVMETFVNTISIAMQMMTEEEEMHQMLYSSLSIANDAFDAQTPVSEEEFAALEKGIHDQTNQILETALFHAIGEKFDFTNEKQKRGITEFMNGLKGQTHGFSVLLSPAAEQIATTAPFTASDLKDKIAAMIDASSKYNRERVDALGMADGNRNFHTETKNHLNELSRQLLSQCTPLSNRLNTMKNLSDEMVFCDKLLQPLLLSLQAGRRLSEKVQDPRLSAEDMAFCKLQMNVFARHLETLRINRCPQPLFEEIQRREQEFSKELDTIETLQKAEGILQKSHVLFLQLRQKKIASLGTPPSHELKSLEKHVCDLLNTLPYPDQKIRLKELVLSFMLANQTDDALSIGARFSSAYIEICAGNLAASNRQLEALRLSQEPLQNRLSQSIQEYTHLYTQNQTSIQTHARELHTEVTNLDTWVQSQNEQPIWNLFIFDMDWVTETVKDLAFDRAKDKIKQLFDALYKSYNYIGFVNQVAILPFLKQFGAHHLKN